MAASFTAGAFTGLVMSAIGSLEALTGLPIAVVDRHGPEPQEMWEDAASRVCDKTGDEDMCPVHFQFMTANTNVLGKSYVIETVTTEEEVCVLVPPANHLEASYASRRLSGGNVHFDYPTNEETRAYLMLAQAARCLAKSKSHDVSEAQADAWAAFIMTVGHGHSDFVSQRDVTPYRLIAEFLQEDSDKRRQGEAAEQAVNVGERILMNHWKAQAAAELDGMGCRARVVRQRNLDLESRTLKDRLGPDACGRQAGSPATPSQTRWAEVTDENLHLWMNGPTRTTYRFNSRPNPHATVGEPPKPYKPFDASFGGDVDPAVKYGWDLADRLGR